MQHQAAERAVPDLKGAFRLEAVAN